MRGHPPLARMRSEPAKPSLRSSLNLETLPIFLMFFFWGFGTGGLWLVRPLFAFEVGGTFFLVALIASVSAMPRVVAGPLTGYLADRYGRRLFVVVGSVLHMIAMTGDFFVDSYTPFLLLEILGGIGIATWMTSANVLMADNTSVETRGRVVAVRETSSRIGLLTGPVVGGVIASLIGLSYVFLFIAATKVVVIIVTVLWIKETYKRGDKQPISLSARSFVPRIDLSMFKTRAFLALSVGTLSVGLVVGGTGVFRGLFPAQMESVAGLTAAEIGYLIAISGVFALIGSFPAGLASDRFGRKWVFVGGLGALAISTYLMSITGGFAAAIAAVMVFGLAEAFAFGTVQVYAMDMAPQDRRGAFLGVWSLFTNSGQITGPLVIGGIADWLGFQTAFVVVTVAIVIGGLLVAALGQETARRPT